MRLDVEGLSVSYGSAPVLTGVDLSVAPGEWVGVIGPNGAGKSTLLKAVAGLVDLTGRVFLSGQRQRDLDRRSLARSVAYVPQDPVMPVGMNVAEYLLLGRNAHIAYLRTESRQDLEVTSAVLEELDLSTLADRMLDSLIGGERQRAVLGRALVQEAPILLLDEPTSALDVGHQQQVLELVERLRTERELVVLSAMHDLTLAAQFADRLLLLAAGQTVALGAARAVLTEQRLEQHYGARVRVLDDEDGGVIVVPVRSRRAGDRAPEARPSTQEEAVRA